MKDSQGKNVALGGFVWQAQLTLALVDPHLMNAIGRYEVPDSGIFG